MKIRDLKEEDLRGILEIYCELVGDTHAILLKDEPAYIKTNLLYIHSMNSNLSLKISSRWGEDSKLRFERDKRDISSLNVFFEPHLDPAKIDKNMYRTVLEAKNTFEKRVAEYLKRENVRSISHIGGIVAALIMTLGIITLNTNITGNIISNANQVTSNFIGAMFFVLSLILGYLYLRPKN
jgi:hypothetical protein